MTEATWGLLGPEFLPNARRTRTLGLGASVRRFNDLAVPGLGGVWFGKQLLLATLGVAVAENARSQDAKVQNIAVANAIEALACRLAFEDNGWSNDARLRGKIKLQGKTDFSFRRVRQRNFYVSQPMRTATVQALPALGFVESDGTRFNAFRCSEIGKVFVEEALVDYRPYNRTVIEHLTQWVLMKDDRVDTPKLRDALSPLNSLSDIAIQLLRERLFQGGNESREDKKRRSNALAWVESLRAKPSEVKWEHRPQKISEEHWHDLQAGALFFGAREAAIAALDAAEVYMDRRDGGQSLSLKEQFPDSLQQPLEQLKSAAKKYRPFSFVDEDARIFCQECARDDHVDVLRELVRRDGRVLRLVGDEIKPGPAFRGSTTKDAYDDEQDREAPKTEGIWPEGISYRVHNLYLLNLDMHGELEGFLAQDTSGDEA